MTSTTRRQVLSGAAAACAALLTANPRAARASAPIATQQNAGFYRFKVGDIEVTILHDGARTFPYSDSFVKNATREQASRRRKRPSCRKAW